MKGIDMEASLNPIRLRIILLLSQNGEMTTSQIKEEITDVAQATLYRHIKALVEANIIKITKENRVRGTIEKIYSMNMEINKEEPTDDEILGIGHKFIVAMLSELAEYSKRKDRDVKRDMLAFQMAPLFLSDEEFMEFSKEIGSVYQKYIQNKAEEGRVLRNIYTVVMPKK